jgi:protein-S-isoprenylcysteine O-methyltransferase Ste14
MNKTIILLYGVFSYFVGVAGLACIILSLAGFLPYGFLGDIRPAAIPPMAWNFGLVAIWGVIHTITARPGYKAKLTKLIPEPAERSTYVLVSGVTSAALIGFWANLSGMLWQIEATPIVYILWGLFGFGWAFLLAATFAINHFDLFGLRQVFLEFRNQGRPPLRFTKRLMYRYVRHPIQTGVLIGVWATPAMSMTQIALSMGFTVYIFIGLWFEERDLVAEHGDEYRAYKKEAGSVLPWIG